MPAYVADSILVQTMQGTGAPARQWSCNTLAEGLPLLSHVAMATNGAADDLAAKIKVTFALIWRGVGVHPLSHKLKHAKSVCILYPRKHAKDTTALNPKPLNPKP